MHTKLHTHIEFIKRCSIQSYILTLNSLKDVLYKPLLLLLLEYNVK